MITNIKIPLLGHYQKVQFLVSMNKLEVIEVWVKVFHIENYGFCFYYGKPQGLYLLDYTTTDLLPQFESGRCIRNIPVFKKDNPYPIAIGH